MYDIIIGIDTGVNTGIAIWHCLDKLFIKISTEKIHKAMDIVSGYSDCKTLVRVEDARLRKWFGKAGKEQLQGAGSIKRDAKIWEDFLTDKGIPFELVAPKKGMTKLDAETFKKITKYTGRTTSHSRDAALLVFGY